MPSRRSAGAINETSASFLSAYARKLYDKSATLQKTETRQPSPPANPSKKSADDLFMEDYLKRKEAYAAELKQRQRKAEAANRERERQEAEEMQLRRKKKQEEDAIAAEEAKRQAKERRANATSPHKPPVPSARETSARLLSPKAPPPPKKLAAVDTASPRSSSNKQHSVHPPSPLSNHSSPSPKHRSEEVYGATAAPVPPSKPKTKITSRVPPKPQTSKKPSDDGGKTTAPAFAFTAAAPQDAQLVTVSHDIHSIEGIKDIYVHSHHESHWAAHKARTRFHHDEQGAIQKVVDCGSSIKEAEVKAAEAQKFENKTRRLSSDGANHQQRKRDVQEQESVMSTLSPSAPSVPPDEQPPVMRKQVVDIKVRAGRSHGPTRSRLLQPAHVKQHVTLPMHSGTLPPPSLDEIKSVTSLESPQHGDAPLQIGTDAERMVDRRGLDDTVTTFGTNTMMTQQQFNTTIASTNAPAAQRHASTVGLVSMLEQKKMAEDAARAAAKKKFHRAFSLVAAANNMIQAS